jgi:RNA polymerase sigma-70 factor (ECF subfamily)
MLTADRIYERRSALTVLEQVLARLAGEYEAAGNRELFSHFEDLLAGEQDGISQAQIASEMGMSENAVKQAYLRFRRAYREALCEEIAQTVAMPGDVEDELRHLIAILRA